MIRSTITADHGRYQWFVPFSLVEVEAGFQTLTIPVSGAYQIEICAPGQIEIRTPEGIGSYEKHPGVRIIGSFKLKKGQKITVALGQQGNHESCGSGGSFCVLNEESGPRPLLIAGGTGAAHPYREEFGRGNIKQASIGQDKVGSSGVQHFLPNDEHNVYCAGAGYSEAPRVSNLAQGFLPPKSFKDGLTGGRGFDTKGDVSEGGFGGGGVSFARNGSD